MKKLKQGHGNYVTGDRFWGRERELNLFMQAIHEGAHQLLVAQRRMGKTSLMREAARRLEKKYTCLYLDVQKAESAPDLLVELSLALRPHASGWRHVKDLFSNTFAALQNVEKLELGGALGITLRAGLTSADWSSKADQLLNRLAQAETPTLLLIDELPILVNRMLKGPDFQLTPERRKEVDVLMSWLRDNALRHQGKIRMVLSGSIGLEPILRQAHLSGTLNVFEPFHLEPWSSETAVGCLQALAAEGGLTLQEGVAEAMVERIGVGIPHHVQTYYTHTYRQCHRLDRTEVTRADVERIYVEEMLSVRGHADLTHYEERLRLVLGHEHFGLALAYLTEAAVVGSLTPEATLAIETQLGLTDARATRLNLLNILEHDGYLRPTGAGYRFVSHLIRDWWKARHGFGYVPATHVKETP